MKKLGDIDSKVIFSHYISLGSFCSVALDLERFGFRDASYPFDWVLSPSFEVVVELIKNNFDSYLDYSSMYQWLSMKKVYENVKNSVVFVHDFDAKRDLKSQFPEVEEKYSRRIRKFYNAITEPTLFIRYIETEGDLHYILDNQVQIIKTLKEFNSQNDIVYIANDYLKVPDVEDAIILTVRKDEDDSVARKPFDQHKELIDYLSQHYYSLDWQKRNLDFYEKKIACKSSNRRITISKKISRKLGIIFGGKNKSADYVHYLKLDK